MDVTHATFTNENIRKKLNNLNIKEIEEHTIELQKSICLLEAGFLP